MDLLLNREKHDLVFVNGECPTTGDLVDRVTQRLYIRLRTFLGEWFLDERYGVPWLEEVLGKKAPKSRIDMVIQSQILAEDGVQTVLEFKSTLGVGPRNYSCSFRAKTVDGTTTQVITV